MKNFSKLFLVLGAVLLVGQGCISFKGDGEASGNYGVWKSIDGASTWEKMTAYPTPQGVGDLSSVNVNELILDPSDRFALYVGSVAQGLFYSYDAANSWMRVREPYLREGRVRAVAVDPRNKCTLYVARSQRLSKSVDCGRTFNTETFVDTRDQVVINDIEVDWFNTNNVYITNTVGEVLKSTDAGDTWKTIYRGGGAATDLEINNADSRILMLATAKRGIKRSVDSGENWVDILTDGYKKFEGIENVKEIQQTADGAHYWIATDNGLARSEDRGETWMPVSLLTPASSTNVVAVAVDPRNAEHIVYVAGQTIYVSVNGGSKWDTEKMPTNAWATQLSIDPTDSSTIYMGLRAVVEQSNSLF